MTRVLSVPSLHVTHSFVFILALNSNLAFLDLFVVKHPVLQGPFYFPSLSSGILFFFSSLFKSVGLSMPVSNIACYFITCDRSFIILYL